MTAKKRHISQYGTVEINGHTYYRTIVTNAEGNRVPLYAKTREELYDKETEALEQNDSSVLHRKSPTVAEYCEKWLIVGTASKVGLYRIVCDPNLSITLSLDVFEITSNTLIVERRDRYAQAFSCLLSCQQFHCFPPLPELHRLSIQGLFIHWFAPTRPFMGLFVC